LAAKDIAARFLQADVQTIVFARARLTTEVLLGYLRDAVATAGDVPQAVQGYRGGYLPTERRHIERGLREGAVRGVVATNALELGVDIGQLSACVMAGYPGTIASAWQQAGRAGRRAGLSVAVLVASALPLDQYLVTHPRYFFGQPVEQALLDPDNLAVLASHLACAAFELPFEPGERFGDLSDAGAVLDVLAEEGVLHRHDGHYTWIGEGYPAGGLSLRTNTPDNVVIQDVSAGASTGLSTGTSAGLSTGASAGLSTGVGSLRVQVTATGEDTALAGIMRLVKDAQQSKSHTQLLADRAAGWLFYVALGVAVVTAAAWIVAVGFDVDVIARVATVLVIACPHALGLAIPLVVAITTSMAASNGILVRDRLALEQARKVDVVMFDKTGTLTRGRMAVVASAVDLAAATTTAGLLCRAAAVEQFSEHPIARAIVAACPSPLAEAGQFQILRGLGASAQLADQRVMVGSARFLGIDGPSPLAAQAEVHALRGETVVWVGWERIAAGFVALRDEPNPTAGAALRRLEVDGLHPVILSGDYPRTTAAIDAELGVAEFEGHCPPGEKAARIQAWQAAGERVAMAGDGVNDAPALAQADLGIALGTGADVALEAADLTLIRDDLTLIPKAIRLSRQMMRTIRQNLFWAFFYNVVMIPLAILGMMHPVLAEIAMATSSVTVVTNANLLRRVDISPSYIRH